MPAFFLLSAMGRRQCRRSIVLSKIVIHFHGTNKSNRKIGKTSGIFSICGIIFHLISVCLNYYFWLTILRVKREGGGMSCAVFPGVGETYGVLVKGDGIW